MASLVTLDFRTNLQYLTTSLLRKKIDSMIFTEQPSNRLGGKKLKTRTKDIKQKQQSFPNLGYSLKI